MESNFFNLSINVPAPISAIIAALSTILAGLMAGLILCVFSLDVNRLNNLILGPNSQEACQAKRVLTILKKPHWLLITLLLWNDLALELIPLLLSMFLHPIVAICVSVFLTLVFGEIIPQAVFIHHAFSVSAYLASFVHLLMWLSAPIAWPIGKLLDVIVGDKKAVFLQRRQLRELIRYQEELRERKRLESNVDEILSTRGNNSEVDEGELTKEEMTIMLNILSLSESNAGNLLRLSIERIYKLHSDSIITARIIEIIFANGYNYVAVYDDESDPFNVTSVLMTKALIPLIYRSEDDIIYIKDLQLLPLTQFNANTSGTEIFVALQKLSPPIAAITDEVTKKVIGLLTLDNIIETVHQTTFKPEMDPQHKLPMQQILHSWKNLRRIDQCHIEMPSHYHNIKEKFSLHSTSLLKEETLRCCASSDSLGLLPLS